MTLEALQCIRCGAPLKTRTEDGYKCDHCGMHYFLKTKQEDLHSNSIWGIPHPTGAARQEYIQIESQTNAMIKQRDGWLSDAFAAIRKHRGRLLEDDGEE